MLMDLMNDCWGLAAGGLGVHCSGQILCKVDLVIELKFCPPPPAPKPTTPHWCRVVQWNSGCASSSEQGTYLYTEHRAKIFGLCKTFWANAPHTPTSLLIPHDLRRPPTGIQWTDPTLEHPSWSSQETFDASTTLHLYFSLPNSHP